MNSVALRIISIFVLIAVVLMFTGLATTIYAQTVRAEKTCHDHCNQDKEPGCPAPCATPSCPFFLCITAEIAAPIDAQVTSPVSLFIFPFVPDSIPDPFVRSIFHPPSFV